MLLLGNFLLPLLSKLSENRLHLSKSKEDGVKTLPKGIYYNVLSEGNKNSATPTVRSIITAHYTGKTIDGKQFDSTRFKLS